MKFKAILFDFNGVILWDREWHEQAWNELSKKVRGRQLSDEESEKYVHGRTPGDTVAFIIKDISITKEKADELLLEKEKLYHKIALARPDFKLSPGAEELFNLVSSNNLKQTIATSSPQIHIDFYYKYLNLGKWFPKDKIVYDQGKLPSKPAPDIYLAAAKNLETDIKECLVIEDARSGLESAKNAGAGKIIALLHEVDSQLRNLTYVDRFIENLGQISLKEFS